jgi:hypothetical protein
MRIDGITSLEKDGTKRVSARISWDDCCREPYEMFFETDGEFGNSLHADPHAFLIASIVPAMHFGERRIRIEEPICPEILDGIRKVMQVLASWNRDKGMQPVAIETTGRLCPAKREERRSAFFYSGGIDSLATLRNNRLSYAPDHHRYFRDGLLIFGIEQDDRETFRYVLNAALQVAREADFELIPIRTNMYLVFKDEDARSRFRFWNMEYGGAALAAVAHAFSERIDDVTIAGNCDPVNLGPWGTHPIIDPNFSNRRINIRHDGVTLSRLDKIRLIADWDLGLKSIRVCNHARRYRKEMINCGQCEKCIRTMLELQAIGKLEATSAFPFGSVTADLVSTRVRIRNDFVRSFYEDVIPLFRQQGREDLVQAIQGAIRNYDLRNSLWRQRAARLRRKMEKLLGSAAEKARRQSEPCA